MLMSDKIDFKKLRRIKRQCILIKGSIHHEDITILGTYAPKNKASKYMKQKLIELQGDVHKSTILVGYLNIPLLVINRTRKKKTRKSVKELKPPSINWS